MRIEFQRYHTTVFQSRLSKSSVTRSLKKGGENFSLLYPMSSTFGKSDLSIIKHFQKFWRVPSTLPGRCHWNCTQTPAACPLNSFCMGAFIVSICSQQLQSPCDQNSEIANFWLFRWVLDVVWVLHRRSLLHRSLRRQFSVSLSWSVLYEGKFSRTWHSLNERVSRSASSSAAYCRSLPSYYRLFWTPLQALLVTPMTQLSLPSITSYGLFFDLYFLFFKLTEKFFCSKENDLNASIMWKNIDNIFADNRRTLRNWAASLLLTSSNYPSMLSGSGQMGLLDSNPSRLILECISLS